MKREDHLDRIFQEKLADYSVEPPMYLWEGMMARRARKRPYAWSLLWRTYVLLLAVLLLPAAGAFVYKQFIAGQEAEPEILSSFLIREEPNQTRQENILAIPVSPVAKNKVQGAIAEDSAAPNTSSTATVTKEEATVSPKGTQVSAQQAGPGVRSGLATLAGQQSDELLVTKEPTSMGIEAQSRQPFQEQADVEGSTSDPQQNTLSGVRAASTMEGLQRLPALWQQSASPAFKLAEPQDCHSFNEKGWKVYGDMLLASEIPVRSLTPREAEYSDYGMARIASEKPGFSFSAGGRMTAVAGNGMALRAGLHYTQFNETFSYQNENEQRINIINIFDDEGNIISTDTVLETGTRIKLSYNKYHMVDIPVMAGYELDFPRLTLTVYGGTYINLLFRQKGDILGADLKPASITSSDADALDAFRMNLGMSLAGSIGLNYRLTDKLQVILEPQFRYFLKPFTKDSYSLKQEYAVTTITTGLRFQLFGKKEAKK